MNTFTHDYIAGRFAGGHSIQVCGHTFAPVKPQVPTPKYTLKPLKTLHEIVDAALAGKLVLRRSDAAAEWQVLKYPRTQINIQDLTTCYFAEQVPAPKTMWINGVEVPAPVKGGAWFPYVHRGLVVLSKNRMERDHYWATKEDAAAVLAAMLKPFKELDDV